MPSDTTHQIGLSGDNSTGVSSTGALAKAWSVGSARLGSARHARACGLSVTRIRRDTDRTLRASLAAGRTPPSRPLRRRRTAAHRRPRRRTDSEGNSRAGTGIAALRTGAWSGQNLQPKPHASSRRRWLPRCTPCSEITPDLRTKHRAERTPPPPSSFITDTVFRLDRNPANRRPPISECPQCRPVRCGLRPTRVSPMAWKTARTSRPLSRMAGRYRVGSLRHDLLQQSATTSHPHQPLNPSAAARIADRGAPDFGSTSTRPSNAIRCRSASHRSNG
jgi:hypothetical protein